MAFLLCLPIVLKETECFINLYFIHIRKRGYKSHEGEGRTNQYEINEKSDSCEFILNPVWPHVATPFEGKIKCSN